MSAVEVFKFLESLPAILAIAGFFAYLWFGQAKIGGEVFKKIVDQLEDDPSLNIKKYGNLTPAKLEKLAKEDAKIKVVLTAEQTKLLKHLANLQTMVTILALVVSAALIALSIWLHSRPPPFSLSVSDPKAVNPDAKGLLVDLDPILVEWIPSGGRKQVSVYLENPDSHIHTEKRVIDSDVRSVTFPSSDVLSVATDRHYHGKNRVEAVVEWDGGESHSNPLDLEVGIEAQLRFNGTLLSTNGPDRPINTLFATIDNSTANLPTDYVFKGEFFAKTANAPLVVILTSTNLDGEVSVPHLEDVDWTKPVGFAYEGPDDPKIVRASVYH